MDFFLTTNGLYGLFLLSFLAATVLPLGSEWLLVTLIFQGLPPGQIIMVATLGNFLGGLTTYGLGFYGSTFITTKILRISTKESSRAMKLYSKYGSWSLLLSWLPIIGDPLCLIAGSLKLSLAPFTILVLIGKGARYAILAYITMQSGAVS